MKIIGQPHVLQFLTTAIEKKRLSPSLFFTGPDGVGKKCTALELTRSFFCQNLSAPGDKSSFGACHACSFCRQVDNLGHLDLLIINRPYQAIVLNEKPETQTAIKIESVRQLDKFLRLKSSDRSRRVAIIEEANLLTIEAANALLKVLEEPPPLAQIILIANDSKTLPLTIVSRCTLLRFQPVPKTAIKEWLVTEKGMADSLAETVSDNAGGSFFKAYQLSQEERESTTDLDDYSVEEFFSLLTSSVFKKDPRKSANTIVRQLVSNSLKKLHTGDGSQAAQLRQILNVQRLLDTNASPRLLLENLYLKLSGEKDH